MQIDQDRIQAILKSPHSFYGRVTKRKDQRWYPSHDTIIKSQLNPEMRVLDIGCGDGDTLLGFSTSIKRGVGIDYDPEHLKLAEAAKRERGIQNVEFLLLDFPGDLARLGPEPFDLVYSLRGPLPDTDACIQAAMRLLRPEGLLFSEEIGELHQPESAAIFEDSPPESQRVRAVDRLRAALARNGLEVRLAADVFDKWIYPDVYAWFQYQCNIWTWCGFPLPAADDPRIGRFAERFTNAQGEIETTHHVVWVAGVKRSL